jgi:5-methyltetrahydropteroyltriglutamate--homocysteine methyltransferase
VPSGDEVDALLTLAIDTLGPDHLWVNPDCGLKTRGWPEAEASLSELVAAAGRARAKLAG